MLAEQGSHLADTVDTDIMIAGRQIVDGFET
jgi:hypothetical protein